MVRHHPHCTCLAWELEQGLSLSLDFGFYGCLGFGYGFGVVPLGL